MKRHFLAVLAIVTATSGAADPMRMAVTTSFQNSGLADVLLPMVEADTGLKIQMLVVGTGQALRLGAAGDVDAVLVHAEAAEVAQVSDGHATHRREIMYNDFVILGPKADPAGVAKTSTAAQAFARLAETGSRFASRGDDSGTHKAELAIWSSTGTMPEGAWYVETGSGMGATLNTAVGLGAYVMADRASWLNFGNKADFAILFQGDPPLNNQYSFLPTNPERHPHIEASAAQAVENWLVSEKGQAMIGAYRVNDVQVFFPNAAPR